MCQDIKTTLYHGTISEINKVDVSLERDRKDFGIQYFIGKQDVADKIIESIVKIDWR